MNATPAVPRIGRPRDRYTAATEVPCAYTDSGASVGWPLVDTHAHRATRTRSRELRLIGDVCDIRAVCTVILVVWRSSEVLLITSSSSELPVFLVH